VTVGKQEMGEKKTQEQGINKDKEKGLRGMEEL
jgi:hypothetical protein